MTKVQSHLQENADYMTEASAAALSVLTDEQFKALTAALEDMCGSDCLGVDCGIVKTHETFEDFENSRTQFWSEQGTREDGEFYGVATVIYHRVQMAKGKPRQTFAVADCGDFRILLT